jgi:hypothetical protein
MACGAARAADAPASAASAFSRGDVVSVTADGARLLLGDAVLATPARGHRLVVAETRGDWIGTHLDVNGRTQSGWLHVAAVEGVPGALAYQALRPTGLVPVAAAPMPAACPCVAYEWDPFLVGRYLRHEMDPNLHVWEPWRWR